MLLDATTENLIARMDVPCDESACRIRQPINLRRPTIAFGIPLASLSRLTRSRIPLSIDLYVDMSRSGETKSKGRSWSELGCRNGRRFRRTIGYFFAGLRDGAAVVGSITDLTSETQFTGKPPCSACSRIIFSSGAM